MCIYHCLQLFRFINVCYAIIYVGDDLARSARDTLALGAVLIRFQTQQALASTLHVKDLCL